MSFMLTYSNWSTLSLRSCSVKDSIFSTHFSMPWRRASSRPRLTWLDTRMVPGGHVLERWHAASTSSSHHALIRSEIWSSICRDKVTMIWMFLENCSLTDTHHDILKKW